MTTTESTLTTVASTPLNNLNTVLSKIPIPLWAIGIIAALFLFVVICCCCCICKYCCRKKKKKKSKYNVDLSQVQILSDSYGEKVQPDLNILGLSGLDRLLSYGRLHYSLDYSVKDESLNVGIIELADIHPAEANSTYDPYVRVQMFPDMKKYETKVIKKSLNPVFNKQFSFKVSYDNLKHQELIFTALDFDRFSKHEIIGQVKIKPSFSKIEQVMDEWVELGPQDLSLQDAYLGDICVSLRYIPTSGKLTVLIIEAKNLKRMDRNGLSDPYVKLSIYSNGRRIKKKKTSTKKCTVNPYYNEEFIFDVPFDQIQKILLVITVVDYDRLKMSDEIGQIKIGSQSHGLQLRHWSEMLANPRRGIAQWHALHAIKK